jgi:hypothetical protein
MLRVQGYRSTINCAGISRRSFVQAGLLGLGGMTLVDLLRARAEAAPGDRPRKDAAVILVWLDGGPSQLETYDPKPEASDEVRGPYGAIETNVKGIRISELLPHHAKYAHRMAFIRSVHHDNGDHFAAAHWMLTGRFGATGADQTPRYPSVGSCVAKLRGPNNPALPAYVGVPAAESVYLFPGYQGPAYLGSAYSPFDADFDRKYIGAATKKKIDTPKMFKVTPDRERLTKRAGLLEKIDLLNRDIDRDGSITSMDRYTQQAVTMLTSREVREAFDLDAEPASVAERYGESPWGRYTLLARRLVERGVTFVTVDMPHWDDHDNMKEAVKPKSAAMDQAVASLVQDLDQRGMLDHVLVVVMGEFGRTPKLNKGIAGDPKRTIPGRDHWGNAISVMMAGGGMRMGQVIGATNQNAEHPIDSPYTPEDVLATIYHHLGVDYRTDLRDLQNRPIPVLSGGAPIRQLL